MPLFSAFSRQSKALLPPSADVTGTARRILEVALHLFATKGFAATSVRDLATVLELQPSALYTHFRSKEHLLAALARLGYEVHGETIRAALAAAPADPVARMRAFVIAHSEVHSTYPHLAVVVNEEFHGLPQELAGPSLVLRQKSTALLVSLIDDGVAAGVFAPVNVAVTAAAIGAIGLRLPYWFGPDDPLGAKDVAEMHATLALRMLDAKGAR